MSDLKQMGIPININGERNLIFNLNVIEKVVDKFGNMNDFFDAAANLGTIKWLAVQMLNEDAELWNADHPESPKTLFKEETIGRYVIGVNGFNELQQKVNEALLLGLPQEKVKEVEEYSKNLMTAQKTMTKMNRFWKKKKQ